MRTLIFWLGVTVVISATFPAQGQFIALNDHYAGPSTHSNATTWNVFGKQQGAPGNSGPLKDIVTGQKLPITLTITGERITMISASSWPWNTSPAGHIFRGCDFGNPVAYPLIALPGEDASVMHELSGLDPKKRYRLSLTAVRGGGYRDRWTLMELTGAASFQAAHTPGSYTNGLSPTEVAINTGDNGIEGATAVWTDLVPHEEGVITVISRQYTGQLPKGFPTRPGPYAYAPVALRLEEVTLTPKPLQIAGEPSGGTFFEGKIFCQTIDFGQGEPRSVQWFKDGEPVPEQKHAGILIRNLSVSDAGSYHAVASNSLGSVTTRPMQLQVIGQDTPMVALLRFSNSWHYSDSKELSPNWMRADYDDSGWSSGAGIFAFPKEGRYAEPLQTALSPLDTEGKPIITRYYRTHFHSDTDGSNVYLYSTNMYSDGVIYYLNGQEVLRTNVKDGPVDASTLANEKILTMSPLYYRWALPAKTLRKGDNVLAVEVHPASKRAANAYFGLWLDAYLLKSSTTGEKHATGKTTAAKIEK
jgi:hypothetical protein